MSAIAGGKKRAVNEKARRAAEAQAALADLIDRAGLALRAKSDAEAAYAKLRQEIDVLMLSLGLRHAAGSEYRADFVQIKKQQVRPVDLLNVVPLDALLAACSITLTDARNLAREHGVPLTVHTVDAEQLRIRKLGAEQQEG